MFLSYLFLLSRIDFSLSIIINYYQSVVAYVDQLISQLVNQPIIQSDLVNNLIRFNHLISKLFNKVNQSILFGVFASFFQ